MQPPCVPLRVETFKLVKEVTRVTSYVKANWSISLLRHELWNSLGLLGCALEALECLSCEAARIASQNLAWGLD